jgi:N6-adenosine-specific RNA methylase IME4
MPDEEICEFRVQGKTIKNLTTDQAILFLWCTSSNFPRALTIVEAWGFEYKTHLVWDKLKIGLGLVFRNQHEILIYASKGKPPKPMKVPPSIFWEQQRLVATAEKSPRNDVQRFRERLFAPSSGCGSFAFRHNFRNPH